MEPAADPDRLDEVRMRDTERASLTQSGFKVVLQKSTPPQTRQLITYYFSYE